MTSYSTVKVQHQTYSRLLGTIVMSNSYQD
jgi:hypothetical protein